MTRLIGIVGGKGGVGKTTLVANLGLSLASMGKDVVVLDSNMTTPNLGLHLGIPLYPKTLQDVLRGRAKISEAVYRHPSGLKIIPAGIAVNDLRGVDPRDLPNALLGLLGNTDMIIIDASAGLGREALAAIDACDEIIIITNPELPAVTDALKAAKLAEQVGTKVLGVVINRVTGKKHEMSMRQVQQMLDMDVLAVIPEDSAIQEGISKRTPVVHHKPNAPSSREIKMLASRLVGHYYEEKKPFYERLFSFLRIY
ncbi:MAG: P-loop NTPase [Candidatus Aenigmarchaeota archaeon]|nr:P-loop NTPase [Candidatus Aenigmarchaeota archaeon]